MDKIRIVHVDDNKDALTVVATLLNSFPGIVQVGSFSTANEAKDFILANPVDLAILDIEMKPEDGFWLARQIKGSPTIIAFLTSYSGYAASAFEACAIDYILKPLEKKNVSDLLEKYQKLENCFTRSPLQQDQIEEVSKNYLQKDAVPKRIFIHNLHKTAVIQLDQLLYAISSGPYTIFKTNAGDKYTASKILKVYNEALEPHPDFVRVHRAHIINKRYLKAVLRDKHKIFALMSDDVKLEIAPRMRDEIFELFSK